MTKEEFKQILIEICLSQSQLAVIVDKHQMTISKIERGLIKTFDLRRYLEFLLWRGNMANDLLGQLNKKEGE